MAVAGNGISFFPLYWIFHDQWQYYMPTYGAGIFPVPHYGHMHFWLMGFDMTTGSGDAFSGHQDYSFALVDDWGPRSTDPNQNQLYRVVGSPKWYFRIQEIWRRVFIQPWDTGTTQQGIKYDASPADKTMGPFREGRANHGQQNWVPYWTANARSLPIDYFIDPGQSQASRQNHVADQAKALLGSAYVDAKYNLQHGNLLVDARASGGYPAGVPPFSDALYIWPIIEYQQAVQLDWEILPGNNPDVTDLNDADDNYGDGWSQSLRIPFVDQTTGQYRSPFATRAATVLPFGAYNELTIGSSQRQLVPAAQRLIYADYSQQYGNSDPAYNSPLDLPPEQCGQPITDWHNPWGDAAGGMIIQQCLGGMVEAKCRLILEHKLGGRIDVWVTATTYQPQTPFAGSDQASPPPTT